MQNYSIRKGSQHMQLEEIKKLLEQTYWANDRALEKIKKSIENSVCYGIFEEENNKQIGFARVVTDFTTAFYVCDVIIDKDYRGKGLGKHLMETITSDEEFCNSRGILATRDAHGLYEKYGFAVAGNRFMTKEPKK